MGRLEVSCRRFAILSGIEQDPANYAICVHPSAAGLQRKGTLAIITEGAGSHQSLAAEACKIAQRSIIESYFTDSALSLTSSLLNALDHANTALLRYNYTSHESPYRGSGEVAIQGPSTKLGRSKVGATAVLIRPDGEGIYLSQMAPTQAYVWHNGMLSAIPEPASWQQAPRQSVAVLSGAQGAGIGEFEDEVETADVPRTAVPAPSLGGGPGVEADLVYRRISAGDMVVLLSTNLSNYLDREQAELILSRYDADGVINAFRAIAIDNGLAEAHACVLELGVLDSSGVEEDYTAPARALQGKQVAGNGGSAAGPHGPSSQQLAAIPALKEVLRGPREWLQRRKLEPELVAEAPEPVQFAPYTDAPAPPTAPVAPVEAHAEFAADLPESEDEDQPFAGGEPVDDEEYFWSKQPTMLFTHRPVEIPPYQAAQYENSQEGAPAEWEDEDGEELQFDGWEDAPPALDDPRYDDSHRILFKPATYYTRPEEEAGMPPEPVQHPAEWASPTYQQPSLYDSNDFHVNFDHVHTESNVADQDHQSNGQQQRAVRMPKLTMPAVPKVPKVDVRGMANTLSTAGNWLLTTTRSLVPEQLGRDILVGRGAVLGKVLPLRLVIVGALVLATLLLTFSVMAMSSNGQKAATRDTLQEAQQMETLANQPGLLAADRIQKLQLALDKADQAIAANPQSDEAKLLATKIQNELDQAQGITRFGSVKLLLDLGTIGNAAKAGAGAGADTTSAGTAASAAANPVSATMPLAINDIIVQSNDAYILDRTASKLYKCQMVAATCSAVLGAGDSAGGQQAGKLVGLAMRLGSPVVIDDKFTAYSLSSDTANWQAEKLGNSDTLQAPRSVATYDGNLYLLDSKPGQISKYLSGQYTQASVDWIQDQATIDAMKAPVTMAIDGEIYVALADGRILVMQAGKLSQTITPKSAGQSQSAPTGLYTGTDVKDLYLLRAGDGTITRISKDGNTLATLKAPPGMGLDKLSGMTVDEAKGIYYLLQGSKVFQATAAAPATGAGTTTNTTNSTTNSATNNTNESVLPPQDQPASAPAIRPTVAP